MRMSGEDRAYRLAVASRLFAAVGGGYALTSLLAAVMAMTLPMPRAEASMTAMMVSFVVYAVTIMAVIHCRSTMRSWVWLTVAALPLIALLLVVGPRP